MEEEYRLSSMFNITKYLHNCYVNNKTPDKDFIDNVNFLEKSEKTFLYKEKQPSSGHTTLQVKESLFENMIRLLPFEVYKNYISLSWLEESRRNDSNLIHSLKYYKNLKLLNTFHELIFDDFLKDNNTSLFYDFSKNIFNFSTLNDTKYTEKELIEYLDLLKKLHNEKLYINNLFFPKKKQSLNYNDKYWYRSINNDKYNNEDNNIVDLIYNLSYSPNSLSILKDAIEQVFEAEGKSNVKKLFDSHLSTSHNVIQLCISKNNFKTLNFLKKEFDLSEKDILNSYDALLKEQLSRLDSNNDGLESFFRFIRKTDYDFIKNNYFPNLKSSFEPMIYFPNESLFNKNIKFNNNNINVDLKSIHYYISLHKAFNLIKEQFFPDEKISLPIEKYQNKPFSYYFCSYILKNEKDIKNYSDNIIFNTTISNDDWIQLTKDLIEIFRNSKINNNTFDPKFIPVIQKTLDIIFITQNMNENKNKSLPKTKI